MRMYDYARRAEKGEFWKNEAYKSYERANGKHFSGKLAEYASKAMKNVSGTAHTWSEDQVRGAFSQLGLSLPGQATWGDATYVANMTYADYFGKSLMSEVDCLKHTHAYLADPDGYPEKAFTQWLADNMGKGIDIDWAKFI